MRCGAFRSCKWRRVTGENFALPMDAIYGPRTMMINEHAGSGGDILRTCSRSTASANWLESVRGVGLSDPAPFRNSSTEARSACLSFPIADPDGLWGMEGEGVHPDVEVELDPKAFAAGRDTQLEAAIKLTLAELKAHPPKQIKRPPPRTRQGKADVPRPIVP